MTGQFRWQNLLPVPHRARVGDQPLKRGDNPRGRQEQNEPQRDATCRSSQENPALGCGHENVDATRRLAYGNHAYDTTALTHGSSNVDYLRIVIARDFAG